MADPFTFLDKSSSSKGSDPFTFLDKKPEPPGFSPNFFSDGLDAMKGNTEAIGRDLKESFTGIGERFREGYGDHGPLVGSVLGAANAIVGAPTVQGLGELAMGSIGAEGAPPLPKEKPIPYSGAREMPRLSDPSHAMQQQELPIKGAAPGQQLGLDYKAYQPAQSPPPPTKMPYREPVQQEMFPESEALPNQQKGFDFDKAIPPGRSTLPQPRFPERKPTQMYLQLGDSPHQLNAPGIDREGYNRQPKDPRASMPMKQGELDLEATPHQASFGDDFGRSEQKISVKSPAVRTEEGGIITGKDHQTAKKLGLAQSKSPHEEGFLMSDGSFMTREQAKPYAEKAGQVNQSAPRAQNPALESEQLANWKGGDPISPKGSAKSVGAASRDNKPGYSYAPGALKPDHEGVVRAEEPGYRMQAKTQNMRTEFRKKFEAIPKEAKIDEKKAFRYLEGSPNHGASPEEIADIEKHYKPLHEETNNLRNEVRSLGSKMGLDVDQIEDLVGDRETMHRMVKGKTGSVDSIAQGEEADPYSGSFTQGSGKPTSLKERSYYAIEDENGERRLIHNVGNKPNLVGGDGIETPIKGAKGKARFGEDVNFEGRSWKVKDAYASEVTERGGPEYYENAKASLVHDQAELAKAKANLEYIKEMREDLIFKGQATYNPKIADKLGYVKTKYPGMEDMFVDKRIAGAINKFAPPEGADSFINTLAKWNARMQATLFWNPLAHIRNVATTGVIDRGFQNLTSNPLPYLKKGWEDARTQSKFAQEAFEAGANEWVPAPANRKFFEDTMKGLKEDAPELQSLAKRIGAPVTDIYHGFMSQMHDVLANVNDAVLLGRVRERMATKGESLEEAVREVHKTISNYRVPSEAAVPGQAGRALHQVAGSRYSGLLNSFTRWHYTQAKALVQPAVDIIKGLKEVGKSGPEADRARKIAIEAVGKYATKAVAYEALTHLGDELIQKMTGDENAKMVAWGPLAYIRLIDEMLHGRDMSNLDWIRLATMGLAAPSPIVAILLEAYDYTKHQGIAKMGNEMGKKAFSPYGQAQDYYEKGLGGTAADITFGVGKKPKGLSDEIRNPFE